jgi:integrase
VRFKLAHYVRRAAQRLPTLARKHVTPHTFRHYFSWLTMSSEVLKPLNLRQTRLFDSI